MICLHTMTHAYLVCALWTAIDEHGEPLDSTHSVNDFDPEDFKHAQSLCASFLRRAAAAGIDVSGLSAEQMGHDLALTRNRHGAGFWDRGLGALGESLTAIAHAMGESDAYVGDDGKVHLT